MSKSQKPVRQDYISKPRYINNLPPPPLNPKFLQYNVTEKVTPHQENENLMSSLFRKENFLSFMAQVDEEFGMALNPLQKRGAFDSSNTKAASQVPLHAKDRALLRDAGIGQINKSEPGVSFLRRTEYIAERHASNRSDEKAQAAANMEKEVQHDPEAQLRAVEESFDHAQESLANFSSLKHPRRKNLRAVAAWPLLPDTSMMDTKYLAVKFSGSASLSRELQTLKRQQKDDYDEEFQKNALVTALYKPITSEDGEWVSYYQLQDKQAAQELKEKLQSTDREQPSDLLAEEDSGVYRFRHTKNYDMQYHRSAKLYEELALKFVSEPGSSKRKATYYYPISGRVELKKHRASTNTEINRFLDESTMDVINLRVREPNTNELKKMDTIRSEYDPMEFEGEDEEEEAEAEEEAQEEPQEVAEEEAEEGDVADEFDRATEAENAQS